MTRARSRRRGRTAPPAPEAQPARRLSLFPASLPPLPRASLWAVLVLYLFAATSLALRQPVDLGAGGPAARFSPPDESAHMAYFAEFAATHTLPRFTSGSGNYEAHQPPLYYLLLTPLYLAFAPLGKLAPVLALRMAGVLMGAASVVLLARLACRLFECHPQAVPLATALGGLWPARVIACAGVSNDAAVELVGLAALLVLSRLAEVNLAPRRSFAAGLAVGIVLLIKSSALPLVIVGFLALYLSWLRGSAAEDDQPAASGMPLAIAAACFLAGLMLLWGPWAARNTLIYGDPLAASVFERIFTQDRAGPEYFLRLGLTGAQYYELVMYQTALSFLGVLGQANLYLPASYYWLGFIWVAAAVVLAAVKSLRRDPPLTVQSLPWALLALQLALAVALFFRFNVVFYQAQARYFMPATGPIALYFARPWLRRAGPAWLPWTAMAVYVLLALCPPLFYLLGLAVPAPPVLF
jgi:4-amino-4-deoxy-L-arabinose transferase-like glycosyltransferase